jgi:hypothetical protein
MIKAIKSLKPDKTTGPDDIPPEALKPDIQTYTDMLHPLLNRIWENESVPDEWKKGHLVNCRKKETSLPVIIGEASCYCPYGEGSRQDHLGEAEDLVGEDTPGGAVRVPPKPILH